MGYEELVRFVDAADAMWAFQKRGWVLFAVSNGNY
jgi:hypothetical protein